MKTNLIITAIIGIGLFSCDQNQVLPYQDVSNLRRSNNFSVHTDVQSAHDKLTKNPLIGVKAEWLRNIENGKILSYPDRVEVIFENRNSDETGYSHDYMTISDPNIAMQAFLAQKTTIYKDRMTVVVNNETFNFELPEFAKQALLDIEKAKSNLPDRIYNDNRTLEEKMKSLRANGIQVDNMGGSRFNLKFSLKDLMNPNNINTVGGSTATNMRVNSDSLDINDADFSNLDYEVETVINAEEEKVESAVVTKNGQIDATSTFEETEDGNHVIHTETNNDNRPTYEATTILTTEDASE